MPTMDAITSLPCVLLPTPITALLVNAFVLLANLGAPQAILAFRFRLVVQPTTDVVDAIPLSLALLGVL